MHGLPFVSSLWIHAKGGIMIYFKGDEAHTGLSTCNKPRPIQEQWVERRMNMWGQREILERKK